MGEPARRVGDLAPAPYNPRAITDDEFDALGRSMEVYGDLSGIVYNRRTKRLIGGHQRVRHIPPDAEVEIHEKLKRKTKTGTVARGTVTFRGEVWSYREVSVDEDTEAMMNLAANKHGGRFIYPELPDLVTGLDDRGADLTLAGFDVDEIVTLRAYDPDLPDPAESKPTTTGTLASVLIEVRCDPHDSEAVAAAIREATDGFNVDILVS